MDVIEEAVWLQVRRGKYAGRMPTMEEVSELHRRLESIEKVRTAAIRFVQSPIGSDEENEAASDLEWAVIKAEKVGIGETVHN